MTRLVENVLKHVIATGFICGLISLTVRILDEKLSDGSKKQFGDWVEGMTPKLNSLSADSVYILSRKYVLPVYKWFLSVGATVIGAVVSEPGIVSRIFGAAAMLIGSLIAIGILSKIFKQASFNDAWHYILSKTLRYWIGATLLAEGLLTAQYLLSRGSITLLEYLMSGLAILVSIILSTIIFVCAPAILLMALSLLRIPLIMISRVVLWMGSYPKGAWAGLVFAVTVVMGALRLFL